MEPVIIAVVCAAVFGVVTVLSAFIRHLLLSRDKRLNDKAQHIALEKESEELEKIRRQMANVKRFDSHYQMLGSNKDAIQYIDSKIEEILRKKAELVNRYADVSLKESSNMIDSEQAAERKEACDKLKQEIDSEMAFYDSELAQLQKRRASLWDSHHELQGFLLDQEKLRNDHLDALYKHHTGVLEKVYLRHNENSEHVTRETIQAGTSTFKTALMVPVIFLCNLFKISVNIDAVQIDTEIKARKEVSDVESAINDLDDDSDEALKKEKSADDKSADGLEIDVSFKKRIEFSD